MLERIKPLTGLVSEILDQLPESVWISDSTTFFDPAIGGGQFVKVIESRLRSYGHSDDNIRQRVFGFEYSQALVDLAVNMHKLVGQYRKMPYEDFFTLDKKMKFDVIIGNPPYQAPKKGDYSFWARFVDVNHKLMQKDGFMQMIIPAGWMSPTNDIRQGQRSVLRDILAKENTHYINIDPALGKKYFSGIGQKFTWFTLQKGSYNATKIDFGNSSIMIDLSKVKMLAKDTDVINIKILEKVSIKNDKWNFTRYIMKESWDDISFQYIENYFPRINGNTNHLDKIVYTEEPCRLQNQKKIVLPYNGSEYKFIIDNGNMGCTNSYVQVLEKGDRIDSAKIYFNSPLIKWLGKNKFTQYNEGALINSISKMDLSCKIKNSDIYKFYNFTQEEIDYIEANVK